MASRTNQANALTMRVCSTHGCPNIYPPEQGSRCHDCAAKADKKHWAKTRAYNTKGHRITFRLAVLRRDPICVICHIRQSVVADHYPLGRDELEEQGQDPNNPDHGRGLCTDCDKKQTAARQPGGWHAQPNR
jgi:5-methylcytosine-specific restriction protein A